MFIFQKCNVFTFFFHLPDPVEGKVHKEKLKSKSPSAVNRSRSSSKSSVTGDVKLQNKKESSEEKKKSETKSKHLEKKPKDTNNTDPKSILKPKKHKKHKEDHHKHHHHHHKHHHHKKHKTEKTENSHSSSDTVINSNKNPCTNKDSLKTLSPSNAKAPEQEYDTFILENSKSDLTMKIKKSPSPHTNHEELFNSKKKHSVSSSSSSEDEDDEPPMKKQKKSKVSCMK